MGAMLAVICSGGIPAAHAGKSKAAKAREAAIRQQCMDENPGASKKVLQNCFKKKRKNARH